MSKFSENKTLHPGLKENADLFFHGKPACVNHIHREKKHFHYNLHNELGVTGNDCLNVKPMGTKKKKNHNFVLQCFLSNKLFRQQLEHLSGTS